MKTLFYISKLVYVALIIIFFYRLFQAKKEDPSMKFGVNFGVLIQLWISILLSFLGLYSRYTEETKLASWGVNLAGMLILFLLLVRIIIAGDKKLMILLKIHDAKEITNITVSGWSIVFETKEKKIKVIDYIGAVKELAAKYRDRVERVQRKVVSVNRKKNKGR